MSPEKPDHRSTLHIFDEGETVGHRRPHGMLMPTASRPQPASEIAAQSLQQLRDWAGEVADLGFPHFGEFASRLVAVRRCLIDSLRPAAESHGLEFSESRGCVPDIAGRDGVAVCADVALESVLDPASGQLDQHSEPDAAVTAFTEALDQFISELRGEQCCFVSWQAACRVFDGLCDQFAQLAARNGQCDE